MTSYLRLLTLICLASFPAVASAQETEAPTSQPTNEAQPSSADPFLWEVTGPNGPTYLFGTIHLGIAAQELSPVVWESLRSSPVAVFEADIRNVNAFELMAAGMYPADQSLEHLFEPEMWARLVAAFETSIPQSMLRQYRPWFLYTLISQSLLPLVEPMDLSLMQGAEVNLSELRYLETPAEQTAMLVSVSEEAMVEQIVEWLLDPADAQNEANLLVEAYRAGDLQAVETTVLDPEDISKWPEMYRTLIFERNSNWMAPIEELVQTGGVFVAVGLGHLTGDRSVVALLRERGYTVERVSAQPNGDADPSE